MKKSIVLTSILLSSMALESNIITPATVMAVEHNVDMSKYNIENQVQFVDEDNHIIKEMYVYGKTGTSMDLITYIPYSYDLSGNSNAVINFTKNNALVKIILKKGSTYTSGGSHEYELVRVKNIMDFYDKYGDKNKILSTIEIDGLDEAQIHFSKNQLPDGYIYSYDHGIPTYTSDYKHLRRRIEVIKILKSHIEFKDTNGNSVGQSDYEGPEKTQKSIEAPKGYTFLNDANILTFERSKLNKIFIVTSNSTINDIAEVKVQFLDNKTDKKITVEKVSGKQGTKQKFKIPSGYKLLSGQNDFINMDKEVSSVTIRLEKMKESGSVTTPITPVTPSTPSKPGTSTTTNVPGKVESHSANVTTHASMDVPLFNKDGKVIKNRALASNSNWHVDKKMTLKGQVFYRVATDEWIKAEHVYEYTVNKTVINTTDGSYKHLYNSKGVRNTTRALASNSSWATDKTATINGQKMYRVATDEWVSAADIK